MSKHSGGYLRYKANGVDKCFRIPAGATNISFRLEPDKTFKVGDRVRQKNHHDIRGTITKIYMGESSYSFAETFAELDNGGPNHSYLTDSFELDIQPEPPKNSVVIDKFGFAFQRRVWSGGDGWAQTGFTQVFSWEELLHYNYGPIEVVYQP